MATQTNRDAEPIRIFWLPLRMRPTEPLNRRQLRVFLLVGLASLFGGYDMTVYGFAIPQIQHSLHIPEDQIALTVSYFRLAAFAAFALALAADIVGRRRLLLFTIFGQALATLGTAFAQTYPQFVWLQVFTRVFGYAEDLLCVVVIVEEVPAAVRGWANGTLAAMGNTGAGIAALVFAAVTVLPFGWRSLYVIGALPMFFVGILRRRLPETRRFEIRSEEVQGLETKFGVGLDLVRKLVREHPARLFAVLLAVAAWGFSVAPAAVLGTTYLQKSLGYLPYQATLLLIPGGFVALVLSIIVGRLSDRIGRRIVLIGTMLLAAIAYAGFYSGVRGWPVAPLWIAAFFGLFAGDALSAGFVSEIFPTAYRATVSGLRYAISTLAGALSLALEGVLYDHFHAHGPAVTVPLVAVVITAVTLLFLPEPAGRSLEEIAEQPDTPVAPVHAEP